MPLGGEQFGAWFDEGAAQLACEFFPRYLRHTEAEWAGRPFELAPWQRDRVIRPLFGWKRVDGTRLIRTVYLEVGRKNGKTELAAGVSLIAMMADGEFNGQAYSLACDKDQAKIVFEKAGVMVGFSDELGRHLEVYKTSIFCPALMARFKPLSSKPSTKQGFSPSVVVGDEIHEWPDGELYQVVHDGEAARSQPIELLLTTAGAGREGFGWEKHEYAKKVTEGIIIDPAFLPVIFAADPDDDWTDEAVWEKANPNMGVSPKIEFLRAQFKAARENPRLENNFRRYHLSQWTDQVIRWIPMARWDACPDVPLSLEGMVGRHCFGGLDLSSTTDITALALAFPDAGGGYDLLVRFWMPGHGLKDRCRRDGVSYDVWAAEGWITLTEGDTVDYDLIRAEITGCGEGVDVLAAPVVTDHVDLRGLAIDRWNATQITTQLGGDGVEVVPFGQGYKDMSPAAKEWEKLVFDGKINHGGNPVLRWMMSCVEIQTDPADNIKPVKPARHTSKARIDGIIAGIMAIGWAVRAEKPRASLAEALKRRGMVAVG